ncbi:MAG: response regulator [Candidatus Kerfeldbacteria bacterium CG08_land_8_20_14_0_20_40_16]|uniref:Response regulator n=1 Tax=Candidatus Kerfeldbacteria bacterium CG08_land_8_20_14_0_20_40_16 TaxID=2014244 RepID=A0A2H0YV72_9BACT|nr:MAG: response regulator [Candidatus Kerfeldbacteria bacterium CG08_land_8_20_14_0_20_40_16]
MGKNKSRILLIEDDQDQINMYQFKFEKEGFEFLAARNGKDGLNMAKTLRPDLILLDLVLINENGIEVMEKLKALPETKTIPVIILTNLAKKTMKERSKELGSVDFIIKTQISPADLVKRVKAVLEKNIKI